MEDIVLNSISQWGPLSILVLFAIYIIYNHIKGIIDSKSNDNKEYKNISHDTDIILTQVNNLKKELSLSMELIDSKFQSLKENFNHKHEVLNKRLVNLEDQVKNQPSQVMTNIEEYNVKLRDEHNKALLKQVELGPKLYRIMSRYLDIIDCDHILLGAFHNGTTSLNGIPYCKFDIISEKFNIKKSLYDVEFAPMYKNVDITLHNKLPGLLFQNDYVYFKISEGSNNDLIDIDEILYRRLLGRGISQLALHILRDVKGLPIGFIGCIKYEQDEMITREISACAKEIEGVYNEHLNKL